MKACGDDKTLRAEIESLLDADGRASILENAKGIDLRAGLKEIGNEEPGVTRNYSERAPDRIGKYRIVGKIGHGGMGAVYEATQENPHRRVALKVLRTGLANATLRQRLRREAQILGHLQHPGIAQIYEAGFAESDTPGAVSQPFIAMELIRGVPLDEFARHHELNPRDRLDLVAQVCDALHHAHLRGIIHRDLKPSNIVVDESGQPKILDFGVARATDADTQNVTLQTEIGQLVGTLSYMSPEQTVGNSEELDIRSDVYALGVILYELLAGELPYSFRDLAIHEAVRVISEDEPSTLGTFSGGYRGDVETIVRKAMEKDRERRYASAESMAADIRRYLRSEPISARPATMAYQLKKFAVRNKVLVGGVVTTVLALLIGFVSSLYFLRESRIRQSQLQDVVSFQSSMLTNISAEDLGRKLVVELRRGASQLAESDTNLTADHLAEYNALMSRLDTTGIASRLLDASVLSHAVDAINRDFADQPGVQADLRSSLATVYNVLGLYGPAKEQYEQSWRLRSQHLGPEHEKTLTAYRDSAAMYAVLGDHVEAEKRFSMSQEQMTRVLGEHHPESLKTLLRLGDAYEDMTRLDDAERVYKQALRLTAQHLGETHFLTLQAAESLGNLYRVTSQLDEANRLLRQVLNTRETIQGPVHKDTVEVRKHLAFVLQLQRSYDEALTLMTSVHEDSRTLHGDDHPSTLSAAHSLGELYVYMHKYKIAEPLLRETLDRRSRLLGVEHPATIRSMNTLAHLFLRTDRKHDALPILINSLNAALRTLGPNHNTTVVTTLNLATVNLEIGKFREAAEYAQRSWQERIRIFGRFNYRTLVAKSVLSEVHLAGEDYPASEKLLRELLNETRSNGMKARPIYTTVLARLAQAMVANGNASAAEPICRELLAICEDAANANLSTVGRAERLLATSLAGQGKTEDATRLLEAAIPKLLDHFEEEHWQVQYAIILLVDVKPNQGAVSAFRKSADLLRKQSTFIKMVERALILGQVDRIEDQLMEHGSRK